MSRKSPTVRFCPICGAKFTFPRLRHRWEEAHRLGLAAWYVHALHCPSPEAPLGTLPWRHGPRFAFVDADFYPRRKRPIVLIREATVYDADGTVSPNALENPWAKFPRCSRCGAVSARTVRDHTTGRSEFEVHHTQSRADGGSDDLANLAVLCRPCHVELHLRRV